MNIEKEIFKKCTLDIDKLVNYGFIKSKNNYLYSKNILNNTFKVCIEVTNNNLIGKIYDLSSNEEYVNYRLEGSSGEYSSKVRYEYKNILYDIKNNCYINEYFIGKQSNRITNLIIDKYKDVPQFIWDKFPEYGVFRNKNNNKWYAIIMNVNKNKFTNQNSQIEIINVRLNSDKIEKLLSKKGFLKAYHMNKKSWITILLDNTVNDSEIFNYICESYDIINSQ